MSNRLFKHLSMLGWVIVATTSSVAQDCGWSSLRGTDAIGVTGDWVDTVTVFDDGTGDALYAGGTFATINGDTFSGIAKWDGSTWTSLFGAGGIPGTNGVVDALGVFDDGRGNALYAGGGFVNAGGETANRVAKWDGSAWSSLAGQTGIVGVDGSVRSLAVFDDGTGPALFVGGNFKTAGGETINRLARWNCERGFELLAFSHDDGNLYTINSTTMEAAVIGHIDTALDQPDLWELVWHPRSGLFIFDRRSDAIIEVDPETADVRGIVNLDQDLGVGQRGMAFRSDGVLFGLLNGMELHTIDPRTGNSTFIATVTGPERVEALAFDQHQRLLGVGSINNNGFSDRLYVIDTVSGISSEIAELPYFDVDTLTAAPDGFLYGSDTTDGVERELLRIDPLTGELVNLGPSGIISMSGITAFDRGFSTVHRYEAFDIGELSFSQARSQAIALGGDLVSIASFGEQMYVEAVMAEAFASMGQYWIGLGRV